MEIISKQLLNMDTYISVILPLKLAWTPCYRVSERVGAGDRVSVRFSGKTYSGVVSEVGVHPEVASDKIQSIIAVERGLPPVTRGELELWKFVSEYYLCTIGEVYKAAYPAGKIDGEMVSARVAERAELVLKKKISVLSAKKDRLSARLARKHDLLSRARKDSVKETLEKDIAVLTSAVSEAESALAALSDGRAADDALSVNAAEPAAETFALSAAQSEAASRIKEFFAQGKPVLLHGVTGSGKTEVYMSLAQEAVARGKNVLYLVPEIAVSRQIEDRLRKVFGQRLLAFHSKETSGARRAIASSVRSGAYVVIGTRSSLFLPHHDLGLIIVDEEQDTSYKQDAPAPRYNGRDTAFVLARLSGADLLLGTATPSLESLYNCHIGRMAKVVLNQRYFGTVTPEVEIIDTIAERKKRGMTGNFSFKLVERIRKALSDGGQVLLLRARRAYSPAVQCSECGDIPKCPHCNVTLSLHKDTNQLMCHYCGWRVRFDGRCGKCDGVLQPLGSGTQKIEEEAAGLFPEAKIARLDSDSAANPGTVSKVINEFARGEVNILVGTQIITKGFDFGGISLVAVLQADSLLGQQDFRADERALQILEQFRGRGGRRGGRSCLVIQTSRPDHPVYKMLVDDDAADGRCRSADMSEAMLGERFAFDYPPFSRMIKVIVKDANESRLNTLSSALASYLSALCGAASMPSAGGGAPVVILGPYRPAVDKVSDRFVRHIRISLKKDSALSGRKRLIAECVEKFEKERAYSGHIVLDVDPV